MKNFTIACPRLKTVYKWSGGAFNVNVHMNYRLCLWINWYYYMFFFILIPVLSYYVSRCQAYICGSIYARKQIHWNESNLILIVWICACFINWDTMIEWNLLDYSWGCLSLLLFRCPSGSWINQWMGILFFLLISMEPLCVENILMQCKHFAICSWPMECRNIFI